MHAKLSMRFQNRSDVVPEELTQGHSRLSSNKALVKEAKHLKRYAVT